MWQAERNGDGGPGRRSQFHSSWLRKRYGQAIRAQVAGTLESPTNESIDAEMRYLREALGE